MPLIDPREPVFDRIIGLDPMMPHYYTHLIAYTKLLFDKKRLKLLDYKIEQIEGALGMSMQEGLNLMESNEDQNAYFKKFVTLTSPSGNTYLEQKKITKYQIFRELDGIRQWIFLQLKEIQNEIRFQRVTIT